MHLFESRKCYSDAQLAHNSLEANTIHFKCTTREKCYDNSRSQEVVPRLVGIIYSYLTLQNSTQIPTVLCRFARKLLSKASWSTCLKFQPRQSSLSLQHSFSKSSSSSWWLSSLHMREMCVCVWVRFFPPLIHTPSGKLCFGTVPGSGPLIPGSTVNCQRWGSVCVCGANTTLNVRGGHTIPCPDQLKQIMFKWNRWEDLGFG